MTYAHAFNAGTVAPTVCEKDRNDRGKGDLQLCEVTNVAAAAGFIQCPRNYKSSYLPVINTRRNLSETVFGGGVF
jgi:hypothetical protein